VIYISVKATDRHEAARGLFATAELLVSYSYYQRSPPPYTYLHLATSEK